MSNSHLLTIQKFLREEGVLISFSGRFSQSIIVELGEALKKHLEEEKRPKDSIYNVFSIFIEQTQNINNYCTAKENSISFEKIAHSSIVTIGSLNQTNYIYSGNILKITKLKALFIK